MIVKKHQTCRICQSPLTEIMTLGDQCLQGSFVKGDIQPSGRRVPLNLMWCDQEQSENACGLVQLQHTINPNVLYRNYWYQSGTNQTMTNHLKDIAEEVPKLFRHTNIEVLDIGCNDGTLLNSYPYTFLKWGIDPASVTSKVEPEVTLIQATYPQKSIEFKKFDIITSIAMFYDLEEPREFVQAIKKNLGELGVWVVEFAYLPLMLKNNAYDNICHEHIEYYSLSVVEDLLKEAGLRAFRAQTNDINCGSLQLWITHDGSDLYSTNEWQSELDDLRQREFDLNLDGRKPYDEFADRVLESRADLMKFVYDLKAKGKTIHLYGASTKGNTILQSCGINQTIVEYAADRNPDKWGAKTLGTNIPIISEAESRQMKPDYYLVLPWHFRREFLEREKKTKAKFIFPLPNVAVV